VVLAKTIKGWALGPGVEARNITHQAKKLSEAELRVFRDRLQLPIPDDQLHDAPYYHPGPTRKRSGTCWNGAARSVASYPTEWRGPSRCLRRVRKSTPSLPPGPRWRSAPRWLLAACSETS